MKKSNLISNNGVDYELIDQIGQGGSGVVWKAQANNNDYAIKFLTSNDVSKNDVSKIERFNNELKFCKDNSRQNNNIISIIADGEYNGKPYYVMPYYSKTLREIIEEEKDADVLINYILKLCKAVKFIHKKNVTHRDIKPENILIDDDNKLVLADFGIAHFKDSLLTKKSDLLANRNYLAPEQKVKNNTKNITKPADIYALGLIINECFTKQNPAGSSFKIIADGYPLFSEFDTLVTNMIKQNPNERFTIDNVIVEIKFIRGKIKRNLQDTEKYIQWDPYPQEIDTKTLNKIIKRASEDILFAKRVFKDNSSEEKYYNPNWHMKIGYRVDDFLFNLCMQKKIFKVCKRIFDYESNVYCQNKTYSPLNLTDNEEHQRIYQQMKDIMSRYPLNKEYDLPGKILKYFASCVDYHCKEILEEIQSDDFIHHAEENLRDAPILRIVKFLKTVIEENLNCLNELNLQKHISIDWKRTQCYDTNDDGEGLFQSIYYTEENEFKKILSEFEKQWKIIYNKLDDNCYSIKFKTRKQFEKFRKYALQLSKPDDIFEGDVLGIVNHYDYVNDIVEIKLSRGFDIRNTLAKILGLRKV